MSALQLRCHNHVAALLDGHCLRSSAEASDRQDLGRNDPVFFPGISRFVLKILGKPWETSKKIH